jgi:hypothetical protein
VDASDRAAFIVSGGGLYEWNIREGHFGIVNQYAPPDGFAVQNAAFMPLCGSEAGFMLTSYGVNGDGEPQTDWWYYDLSPQESCMSGTPSKPWLSAGSFLGANNFFFAVAALKPVFVYGYFVQIVSTTVQAGPTDGASWMLVPPWGSSFPGGAYAQYNIDAYENNNPTVGPAAVVGQAYDKSHAIYIAVVQTALNALPYGPGPTQVIVTTAVPGYWPYPGNLEPGVVVPNALYATADGSHRIAYTSGTDGMITAIGY